MKTSIALATAFLAAAPVAGFAQDFSGALTFGLGRSDVSSTSNNVDTLTFDGRIGTTIGDRFSLDARADAIRGRMSGVSGHVTGTVLGVSGVYQLPSNLRFGAYAEQMKIDDYGLSPKPTATSVGLIGGYNFGAGKVDAFYGRTTTDPSLPSGTHVHDYGLMLNYSVSPNWTLGGDVIRARVSTSSGNTNLDAYGIASVYSLTDQWTFFGGISHAKLDFFSAKATTYGFGVSYDLSSAASFRSSLALELAHTKADALGTSGKLNTVRLSWTIPFGGTSGKVPMNSVADAVLSPTHSAISSAVLAAF